MPSPNFDELHLRFSRAIEDPVGAASSAGNQFTVAQRSDYINRAINDLAMSIYYAGPERARDILQPLVDTQSVTFSSSGVAVEASYNNMPFALTKSGSSSIFQYYTRKEELDNNVNPNVTAAYLVLGNLLFAYESGAILNSGTGTLFHFGKDVGVQSTTDVNIPPNLWDAVIDIAVILALEETGEMQSASARVARAARAEKVLRGK